MLGIATNEHVSTAGVHCSCLTRLVTPGHLLSYCSSLLVHARCYLAHGPESMEQSNCFELMEWLLQHGWESRNFLSNRQNRKQEITEK